MRTLQEITNAYQNVLNLAVDPSDHTLLILQKSRSSSIDEVGSTGGISGKIAG